MTLENGTLRDLNKALEYFPENEWKRTSGIYVENGLFKIDLQKREEKTK